MRGALTILLGVGVLTACAPSDPARSAAALNSPSSSATRPVPPARIPFEIGDITPPHLAVAGNRLTPQILQVAYSIPDPETVASAEMKVYVSELGDLASASVTPAARGFLHLAIEPRAHSLGTHVRFRASCPTGTTGWYSLGQIPLGYQARMADVFRISSVMPQSIPWSPAMDPNQSAAGNRIKIFGPKLTPDCRIDAQANGSPVELNNVHFYDGHFEGLLLNRDIGYSPVSPRYAELKLVITRTSGQRLQAVQRVPFEGS